VVAEAVGQPFERSLGIGREEGDIMSDFEILMVMLTFVSVLAAILIEYIKK